MVTTTWAASPDRYSSSWVWMFWAVAARSPSTTSMAGTMVMA